jgi:hypothetical protein
MIRLKCYDPTHRRANIPQNNRILLSLSCGNKVTKRRHGEVNTIPFLDDCWKGIGAVIYIIAIFRQDLFSLSLFKQTLPSSQEHITYQQQQPILYNHLGMRWCRSPCRSRTPWRCTSQATENLSAWSEQCRHDLAKYIMSDNISWG